MMRLNRSSNAVVIDPIVEFTLASDASRLSSSDFACFQHPIASPRRPSAAIGHPQSCPSVPSAGPFSDLARHFYTFPSTLRICLVLGGSACAVSEARAPSERLASSSRVPIFSQCRSLIRLCSIIGYREDVLFLYRMMYCKMMTELLGS